jgi:hypothetical protein
MIAFLLLLPVGLVLLWLYWLCLPQKASISGRWRWVDSVLLIFVIVLASFLAYVVSHAEYVNAGPIWPEVASATTGYLVFAIGMSIGLILRRWVARP